MVLSGEDEVRAERLDVTDEKSVRRLADGLSADFGRVSVVVPSWVSLGGAASSVIFVTPAGLRARSREVLLVGVGCSRDLVYLDVEIIRV